MEYSIATPAKTPSSRKDSPSLRRDRDPKCLVSIIIPVYKSERYLDKSLDSFEDFEVIVVDNSSPDECARIAASYQERLKMRIVRLECNRGFAGGVNEGLRSARGSLVLVLNADVELDECFLDRAVTGLLAGEDIAAVGGVVFDKTDSARCTSVQACGCGMTLFFRPHEYTLERVGKNPVVLAPPAVAFLIRMSALEDIRFTNGDYFDSRLWCYGEDIDLWIRLCMRGWRGVVLLECKCWHFGGGTYGGRELWRKPWDVQRIVSRNALLLLLSCLHLTTTLIFLPGSFLFELARMLVYSLRSPGFASAALVGKKDAIMMVRHVIWRRNQILGLATVSRTTAFRRIVMGRY
jgi:GT2 family glycosyltransferase